MWSRVAEKVFDNFLTLAVRLYFDQVIWCRSTINTILIRQQTKLLVYFDRNTILGHSIVLVYLWISIYIVLMRWVFLLDLYRSWLMFRLDSFISDRIVHVWILFELYCLSRLVWSGHMLLNDCLWWRWSCFHEVERMIVVMNSFEEFKVLTSSQFIWWISGSWSAWRVWFRLKRRHVCLFICWEITFLLGYYGMLGLSLELFTLCTRLLDKLKSEWTIRLFGLATSIFFNLRGSSSFFHLLCGRCLFPSWIDLALARSVFCVSFSFDSVLVTIKRHLKCAILQDNVASRNADVEASLTTELTYFVY